MYQLLETIKVSDKKACLLPLHQTRMNNSYLHLYGQTCPFEVKKILDKEKFDTGVLKLRFLYNKDFFRIEFAPYLPKSIRTLKPVYCDDIDYSYKYTDREKINSLLAQKEDCDDILIIKKGLVSDTSFCNIVFFDGKRQLTPNMPLLRGVQRENLLRKKEIEEIRIELGDIKNFISFKLINAMLDFEQAPEIGIDEIDLRTCTI